MVVHEQVTCSVIRGYRPLLLDLHIPDGVERPPVVVWIHGGSFHSGVAGLVTETIEFLRTRLSSI
ncbi:hypothetical protein [Nocardia sp. CA-290969]|uniref:hypothetical protein n=1 Tax=Nocardia sp. CA-290969 TaxID=3239986 RepID=UPI003D8ECA27